MPSDPLATSGGADTRKRRSKTTSYQKMAILHEELGRIDAQLKVLRESEHNSAFSDGVTDGDHSALAPTSDPSLRHMIIVQLCQMCASGDAVGVRLLLHGGIDPNTQDYDDRPLLHIASMNGHASVVHLLLESGADTTITDREGRTASQLAEECGYHEVARLLQNSNNQARTDSLMDSFESHGSSATSSPASQHQPDFSSIPQPMVGAMIVVMIGLPGRGKSYISEQIQRYFQWNGLSCSIFSHQVYRRKADRRVGSPLAATMGGITSAEVEQRVAAEIAADMTRYVHKTGGVAILDGTNGTPARRQALLRCIKDTKRIKMSRVIFVEIICNNVQVVHQHVLRARDALKAKAPPTFVEDYYHLIAQHESVYATLNPITDSELSYIRVEDNTTYSLNMISGWMPSRLAYMLHNLSSSPKNLYLTRPGEYADMLAGRLGGNSRLTERGEAYSRVLMSYFRGEIDPTTALTVFSSCLKRATQTVQPFADASTQSLAEEDLQMEEVDQFPLHCRVSYFPTLDDVNHGDCEGQLMSYVRQTMPSTLQTMEADPYYTAWPNGECIHQVFNGRLEPHIHDIQASSTPVLVVSHLHLLQGLYSYFVSAEDKAVAPQNAYQIAIPSESVIKIHMVGADRVAEVVDLSAKVDEIMQAADNSSAAFSSPSPSTS